MNKVTKPQPNGNFAFIDNQNLNIGVQRLGWKMDWRKFRKFLNDQYGVTTAYMFIGHMPEHEDMYLKLHDAGYLIVLKPTFDMTRPQPEVNEPQATEEKKQIKGNVDAELVLWAVKEMPKYKKAVIISGDGDFYSLIEYLEEQKKLLKILTPNAKYSSLYNKYKTYIERIDKLRKQLSYRDGKRNVRPKNTDKTN